MPMSYCSSSYIVAKIPTEPRIVARLIWASIRRARGRLRRACIVKERVASRDVALAHVPDVACAVDVLTKWVANSLTFHTLFSPALQSTVDCSVSRAHTFMFSLYVAEISQEILSGRLDVSRRQQQSQDSPRLSPITLS